MIHFDTNYLIQATIADSPAHFQSRRWAAAGEIFGISTIAWAEYLCGPLDATGESIARQMFPAPEPLVSADAELAARLFNLMGRRSRSLPDCLIAAVAMRCGAKLASMNTADFQALAQHGLTLA